jgi:hypothetical protein
MRDREGAEALPGTLPERGIPVGGLLHHHGCRGILVTVAMGMA